MTFSSSDEYLSALAAASGSLRQSATSTLVLRTALRSCHKNTYPKGFKQYK